MEGETENMKVVEREKKGTERREESERKDYRKESEENRGPR